MNERIQALGDINLVVGTYVIESGTSEQGGFNPAGFESDRINTDFGWYFKTIPKPTLEQLEAIKPSLDAETLKVSRNKKLEQLRLMRDAKLKQIDVMINELTLNLRQNRDAVIEARAQLLAFTNPYKKINGDAKALIDDLDLNNIQWPEL